MKRILVFIALAIMAVASVSAQSKPKVHAIAFYDTNDPKNGKWRVKDVEMGADMMGAIKHALGDNISDMTYTVYKGDNCSKKRALQAINGLNCEDDIVIFLYSGHGCRSVKSPSKFGLMCMGSSYLNEFLAIDEAVSLMRKKKPRLLVFMANCCNSYYDAPYETQSLQSNGTVDAEAMKKLFLENEGYVMITGATPGEYAWIGPDGSYLYRGLWKSLKGLNANTATWNNFFKATHDDVEQVTRTSYNAKRISNIQHPVYDVSVKKVSTPVKKKTETKKEDDSYPYRQEQTTIDDYSYRIKYFDKSGNLINTIILDMRDYTSPNAKKVYPLNNDYKIIGERNESGLGGQPVVETYVATTAGNKLKSNGQFVIPASLLKKEPKQPNEPKQPKTKTEQRDNIHIYITDGDEPLVDRIDFTDGNDNDRVLRTIMLHRAYEDKADVGEYRLTDRSLAVISIDNSNNYRIVVKDKDGHVYNEITMTRQHRMVERKPEPKNNQTIDDNRNNNSNNGNNGTGDRVYKKKSGHRHNGPKDLFGLLVGLVILMLGYSWKRIEGPLSVVFKIIGVAVIVIYILNLIG